jgi:hypothetical protein
MSVKLLYTPEKPQFEPNCFINFSLNVKVNFNFNFNFNYVVVGRHLIFHQNNMIDVYDLKTVYGNVGSPPFNGPGPIPFDGKCIPKEGTAPVFSVFLSTNNYELEGIPVDESFAADRVLIWCEDKVRCKEMIITITRREITVKVVARTLYLEYTPIDRQNGETETRRVIREAFDEVGLPHVNLPTIEYVSRDRCYYFTIDSYDLSLTHQQFIKLYSLLGDLRSPSPEIDN